MAHKRPRKTARRRKTRSKNNRKRKIIIGAIGLLFVVGFLAGVYWQFTRSRSDLFHTFDDPAFSDKYFVRGVDVSHHNSFINWDQLREENITFVYLKSTEGVTHKDKEYKDNYRLAKNAGLKVGTYHFYSFRVDGKQQAGHFIRSSNVFTDDMIPAIDVEHSKVNIAPKNDASRNEMLKELKELEQALFDHYGKHPVIYTNKDCYRAYIESEFPENPIWICDLRGEPDVASDKWVIWQFSHSGNINGVLNNIDLNYYRYSFTDFKHLLMP